MKSLILLNTLLVCCSIFLSCNAQNSDRSQQSSNGIVGGGCDGCEIMYIGMPEDIASVDTSDGWYEAGQKLILTGTVYQLDGKTPASDVIVYYWQTDHQGYYSPAPDLDPRASQHGHIRGWVKTGADGKYSIYTVRPAPYPNEEMPAHIHLSIKEPDIDNEYYTDDINFDDDELLIPALKRYPQQNRAGSGIVRVLLKDSLQIAEHDIILGLNIPNYPKKSETGKLSGLNIGEDQPSFIPYHAYGPDKGSRACPVCKYGRYHGIVYFVGNNSSADELKEWLRFLEQESISRQQYLKVYLVYGKDADYSKAKRERFLAALGDELRIQYSALTFVPSFSDQETEAYLNKIDQEVENTFIIYKHRSIVDKYVDLKPTAGNFKLIAESLDRTKGDLFSLEAIH